LGEKSPFGFQVPFKHYEAPSKSWGLFKTIIMKKTLGWRVKCTLYYDLGHGEKTHTWWYTSSKSHPETAKDDAIRQGLSFKGVEKVIPIKAVRIKNV